MIRYSEKYWENVGRVIKNIPGVKKLYGKVVLLTGGTGLICSAIVDVLQYLNKYEEADIKIILAGRSKDRIVKRFPFFLENSNYEFVEYDATKEINLDIRADFIIFGASNANPKLYVEEPVETLLANIVGLNNMLKSAVENKTDRVLYISSSEVYGNIDEVRPRKEQDYGFVDILNMRASYPSGKRAAETLCVAYNSEHHLDTVIARPGHIYGPSITNYDNRATAEFTRDIAAGRNIVMKSKGNQLRSYCYSLDCASAILTILLCGESCKAYNISNKESVCTISEIANALAMASDLKVEYKAATENEKQGYNLMTDSSLDATELENIGWKAEFSLEEGTKNTIDFYVE